MEGAQLAVETLRSQSKPVTKKQEKAQVASVSAHNNTRIGELVAEALESVGAEGAVTVEEAKGTETTLDVVEGMQFDRGYLSPYFVTNPEKMTAELDKPLVLLHEKKISSLRDLLPLLEQIAKSNRPLVIIAEDIDGEALATLVVNQIRGVITASAVKAPGFGDRRKETLRDIAILTGGEVISEELGQKLENLTIEDLGTCDRVVIDKDATTLVGGAGDREAVEGRMEEIRRMIEMTTSDYDREKLEERLAKLSGGVAVIRVGAPTEAELKNDKDAFDDAISSTKAAIEEGIVPGGGLALLRAAVAVEKGASKHRGDKRVGMEVLAKALEAPVRQIAINSEWEPGVVVERLQSSEGNIGFDASSGEFLDLEAAGIIDPTKVARTALENAVSVASTLLLAEAALVEVEDPKEHVPGAEMAGAGGLGAMGGM